MKIDAKVQSISKLKDYFFLVPDYINVKFNCTDFPIQMCKKK